MSNTRHIHHVHRRAGFSYPVSLEQRLYSLILWPLLAVLAVSAAIRYFALSPAHPGVSFLDTPHLISALGATFLRLAIAYIIAAVLALPLALIIDLNDLTERLLLPVFDILQSVPVLAFFPVVVLIFLRFQFLNGAAVFILIITMIWSMVFSLVGGLKAIPWEVKAAAQVFHIRGLAYVRKILLPAVMPYLITGSLLAWASGWNIVIVAEVLHTYIPAGGSDLFGIGSILVGAVAAGNTHLFLAGLAVMIVGIALLNLFVWQKLLHYAERFKFE